MVKMYSFGCWHLWSDHLRCHPAPVRRFFGGVISGIRPPLLALDGVSLVTAVPCFAVLVLAWRIATNIGRDRSFSNENASLLKWISVLAAADAAFFFLGNVVMLLLDMSHPSVVLASFIIVFAGIAVAVISAVLSHLVKKAAVLQEESDLTI